MPGQAFPLESVLSLRSLRQCWQRLVARLVYPRCRDQVVAEINRRAGLGGLVTTKCRCGEVEVVSQAAPLMVTVCHCSVCRYDEAASLGLEDAPAPSFCAVPRASCRLVTTREDIFTFRNSSDFARRGRCELCSTALVMDYEWFEPNTVWLVRPVWQERENCEKLDVEHLFNEGKADIDVCWNSRGDPCKMVTKVSYLGEEPVRDDTGNDSSSLSPRGVIQSKDLDFSYYYLDCGIV